MKNTTKLVAGGIYTNQAGDRITITHLDKQFAAYVETTAGGVDFDDEETTVEGLRTALKGYRLTGRLAA